MAEKNVVSIIVAMDKVGGIGKKGRLPFHLPRDMQYFKACTWGHPIIVGRRTFQSFKNYLPARCNIVLTREGNARGLLSSSPFLYFVSSIEEALRKAQRWHTKEIFIIGGMEVYAQSLSLVHQLYITRVAHTFPETDAFFPEIHEEDWMVQYRIMYDKDACNPYDITFEKWVRK